MQTTPDNIWPNLLGVIKGDMSGRPFEVWEFLGQCWWRDLVSAGNDFDSSGALARWQRACAHADAR